MKEQIPLKLCWLHPEKDRDMKAPAYHSDLASGMDVAAAVDDTVILQPGEISMIPTGFAVAIAPGYELQVRPRSGLAIKHGITIVNAPGTIDADYRGEVRIGLINLSRAPFTIKRGDRVAQLVLSPVSRADLQIVGELDETVRQAGGFGHTGL